MLLLGSGVQFMAGLALLKLRDVESFSTMFLNHDLLARRFPVPSGCWPATASEPPSVF